MELWPNDATRRSHSKTPGAAAGRSSRDQELKGKKEEKEKKAGKGGLRQRKFETSFFLLTLLISFLFPVAFSVSCHVLDVNEGQRRGWMKGAYRMDTREIFVSVYFRTAV